jgi:hypothetical protein
MFIESLIVCKKKNVIIKKQDWSIIFKQALSTVLKLLDLKHSAFMKNNYKINRFPGLKISLKLDFLYLKTKVRRKKENLFNKTT